VDQVSHGILTFYEERKEKPDYLMSLTPGLRAEITMVVAPENTAIAIGSGDVEVLATPILIAWMERAACQAVTSQLEAGTTTVGTFVQVRHLAATPVGQRVQATAELVEVEGRRLVFRVQASDEKQPIGEGLHERVVVKRERFGKNAESR
jgi:predicted thioesterase